MPCLNKSYLAALLLSLHSAAVYAGSNFTLIGVDSEDEIQTEANSYEKFQSPVRDMTTIRAGDEEKQEPLLSLNHDSGLLDVYETNRSIGAPLDSISFIEFIKLEQHLRNYGWSAKNASQLRATLKLRVLVDTPPRMSGSDASSYYPRQLDIDPPPPNVPVSILTQTRPWFEGSGQNNYHNGSRESEEIDLLNIGMIGFDLLVDHPLLSQDSNLFSRNGSLYWNDRGKVEALTLSDVRIDKERDRWAKFDVSSAVQDWLTNGFQHGFLLAHLGGDQSAVRNNNFPWSRTHVSFVSSSAAADCRGAAPEGQISAWGADGESAIYEDANTTCRVINDFADDGYPRIIQPHTFPEWRPQLIIENTLGQSNFVAPAKIVFPDTTVNQPSKAQLTLINLGNSDLTGILFQLQGSDISWFTTEGTCESISPRSQCKIQLTFIPSELRTAHSSIQLTVNGTQRTILLSTSVSSDGDGIEDSVENAAPNNGDGNNDGIADALQNHVSSIPSALGPYLTFVGPEGSTFKDLKALNSADDLPRKHRFNLGFWTYRLTNLNKTKTKVTLFADNDHVGPYYRRNKDTDAWESFDFNSDTQIGAFRSGNSHVFQFEEGGTGDLDGEANGQLLDLGGVSFNATLDDTGIQETIEPEKVPLPDVSVGNIDKLFLLLILSLLLYREPLGNFPKPGTQ